MAAGVTVLASTSASAAADVSVTAPASGVVPNGICSAEVRVVGEHGRPGVPGTGGGTPGLGGSGAEVYGEFPVSAGQTWAALFAPGGAAGPDLGLGNTGDAVVTPPRSRSGGPS